MPTTVVGTPFRTRVRPRTPGSDPKRVAQVVCRRTQTGGAPGRASSGRRVRPLAAGMPRNSKLLPLMRPPVDCSVPCAVA